MALGRLLQCTRCAIIRLNFEEGIRLTSGLSLLVKPETGWQTRSFGTSKQGVTKVKMHSRTPYIIFVSEKMGDLRNANPDARIPDLGRKLGQMWRVLPEKEKEAYRARYREEKISFDEQKKMQLEKMSNKEIEKMKAEAQERRKRRSIRRRKKLLKDLAKPKPVDVNPYILFVKEKALERGDAPFQQYVRGMAEYWKKMPEEDKQRYVDVAKENSARYRLKLVEWERKMIKEGHENLVRKSALKRPIKSRKAKLRGKSASKKGTKARGKKTKTVATQTAVTAKRTVATSAGSTKIEAGSKKIEAGSKKIEAGKKSSAKKKEE